MGESRAIDRGAMVASVAAFPGIVAARWFQSKGALS
jgi:hypothetical protein